MKERAKEGGVYIQCASFPKWKLNDDVSKHGEHWGNQFSQNEK